MKPGEPRVPREHLLRVPMRKHATTAILQQTRRTRLRAARPTKTIQFVEHTTMDE
jgi:hypothetical protein